MNSLILESKSGNSIVFTTIHSDGDMEVVFRDKEANTQGLMYLKAEELKQLAEFINKQLELSGQSV